jgi:hypothetical protein
MSEQPGATRKAARRWWWGLVLVAAVGVSAAAVLFWLPRIRDAADRKHENLNRLAQAMLAYADEHNSQLPPAAVTSKDGKPLLSWRVLILPQLGEEELFNEFRLDEPWDSPHNIELLPRMPSAFAPPPGKRSKVPPHHTVCHVFVGQETPFALRAGPRVPQSFYPAGMSGTCLIIEAGEPTPWTKPQEIVYHPNGPLPALTGLFEDGFRAATADGTVHFVKKGINEESLRSAISPHYVRKDISDDVDSER